MFLIESFPTRNPAKQTQSLEKRAAVKGSPGPRSPKAVHLQEGTMQNPKSPVRIELTPEQKAKISAITGKDAEAVELSVEELEERIAPMTRKNRG